MNKGLNVVILFALFVLLIGGIAELYTNNRKLKERLFKQERLYEAITDSLTTWKNKDSLNEAKIRIMEIDNFESFLEIKNLSGTNLELQTLLKKQGKSIKDLESALILKSETKIVDTVRSYYPIGGDTIIFSQSELLEHILNDWINVTFGFKQGKSYFDMKLVNRFDVVLKYEGKSLFKQGVPVAYVTSLNPYTQVSDMRVVTKGIKPNKRVGVSLQTGFGGLYNITNKTIGYGPYVGIGINYNILLW